MHLTNFSVNKKAENYVKNKGGAPANGQPVEETKQDTGETEMSCKWSLNELRKEFKKMEINYDEVFKNIK